MKRVVAAVLLVGAAAQVQVAPLHPREHYEAAFYDWMLKHNINIPAGPRFVRHLENFIRNSDHIEAHNGKNASYTLGHNKFSHLSYEEFKEKYLGWNRPMRMDAQQPVAVMRRSLRSSQSLPASVDWEKKGAVTKVKDQGQCGSCYTFSATGAVEGAYAIKTGELLELSMQQVVDCDNLDGGCDGGEMQNVFSWIKSNGGLCPLTEYPYASGVSQKAGTCHKCEVVEGTAPASWETVKQGSAQALMEALTIGPVSVAVGASKDWMFYKEGIFSGSCESELNHGILAVGYGQSEDGKYWRVKNSWGTGWGVDGYIYLSRANDEAACGILDDASYPILDKSVSSRVASTTSRGSAQATDCGGGTVVFDTITITPEDVQKNKLLTLKAEGVLNKPTTSGNYKLSVNFAGSELYSHSGSLCGNEKVDLPLGTGTVNIYGLECPATPGPVTYGLDVKLPSIAPSGAYEIKITATDQDSVSTLCIDTHLQI